MCFQKPSLFFFDSNDLIRISVLNRFPRKKISSSISLFDPSIPRFFLPQLLFLLFPPLKLDKYLFLFDLHLWGVTLIHPNSMDLLHLVFQSSFLLKYVPKRFLIPLLHFFLIKFDFLLKFVHYWAFWGNLFAPLGISILLEFRMREPKLLKPKGFEKIFTYSLPL